MQVALGLVIRELGVSEVKAVGYLFKNSSHLHSPCPCSKTFQVILGRQVGWIIVMGIVVELGCSSACYQDQIRGVIGLGGQDGIDKPRGWEESVGSLVRDVSLVEGIRVNEGFDFGGCLACNCRCLVNNDGNPYMT